MFSLSYPYASTSGLKFHPEGASAQEQVFQRRYGSVATTEAGRLRYLGSLGLWTRNFDRELLYQVLAVARQVGFIILLHGSSSRSKRCIGSGLQQTRDRFNIIWRPPLARSLHARTLQILEYGQAQQLCLLK